MVILMMETGKKVTEKVKVNLPGMMEIIIQVSGMITFEKVKENFKLLMAMCMRAPGKKMIDIIMV